MTVFGFISIHTICVPSAEYMSLGTERQEGGEKERRGRRKERVGRGEQF